VRVNPVDEGSREKVLALGMMEPPLWRHIPLSNRRTRDLIGIVVWRTPYAEAADEGRPMNSGTRATGLMLSPVRKMAVCRQGDSFPPTLFSGRSSPLQLSTP